MDDIAPLSSDAPPPSGLQPPSGDLPPPSSLVDDAGDLRGFHFRRLIAKRWTRIWIGLGVVLGAAIGFGALGVIFGLFGALAALAIGVFIVYSIASSASEKAFFQTYASQRQMSLTESGSLPPATSLLRKGDERHTDEVLTGSLADGVDGTLALYTYTDVYHDKNGRHETDYRFTVSIVDIPGCDRFVPELYCNRKSGFRFLEGLEDAFRSKERIRLESEEMEEHYEVFVSKEQDQNWIRQLFSPTFIVWLTQSAPEGFAFEIESGTLCCNVKGHKKDAVHLDAMRVAGAGVAKRVREEISE